MRKYDKVFVKSKQELKELFEDELNKKQLEEDETRAIKSHKKLAKDTAKTITSMKKLRIDETNIIKYKNQNICFQNLLWNESPQPLRWKRKIVPAHRQVNQ